MKNKSFWFRMAAVLILAAVTVVMSFDLYVRMIRTEEEVCWARLEIATNSTAQKIRTRMTDNLNFLTAVADAYVMTHRLTDLEAVGAYLSTVMQQTIFDRIDVILPDNAIITQDGQQMSRGGTLTYEQLASKGTHVTQRVTSSFTGKEVFCCVTPIEGDDGVLGLLVGTIDCENMSDLFEVFTYGQEAQLFLIDRTDGSYLMDNWHADLGNIYERGARKSLDGKEDVDMTSAALSGERTRLAYISLTNGESSYQYNAPVEGFNWTVCVVVQEDVVFANVKALEQTLLRVGRIELLVVLVYVLWNVFMNIKAVKSEKRVQQLEYEKARNEARATFISNMSHDIKTPLNGIVGMLQIIRNHRGQQDLVDDCLAKIDVSARYLSTLTSDMLDISEIENDKLTLQEDPIDLHRLAEEVTAMMERQASDAGVTFETDLSGLAEPCILGSNIHLKRILVNLIGNAVKYSRNAGKHVWLSITDEEAEEPGLRLYRFVIRDNGIGMSEEFQKNMYQAFEQELIDARSEYQGYGLGLTIVNHLVRKMNGVIGLESVKGEGSTFTVSIPFQVDPDGRRKDAGHGPQANITGMHLLLVEDNEFNMEIASVLLSDAGATVDQAANGRIATELFAASGINTYDAIIMDVKMPEMDGCEATQVIRAMSRPDAATIPIIAMTANTFAEDIARCLAAGMNAHVPKPIDGAYLIATIQQHRK